MAYSPQVFLLLLKVDVPSLQQLQSLQNLMKPYSARTVIWVLSSCKGESDMIQNCWSINSLLNNHQPMETENRRELQKKKPSKSCCQKERLRACCCAGPLSLASGQCTLELISQCLFCVCVSPPQRTSGGLAHYLS